MPEQSTAPFQKRCNYIVIFKVKCLDEAGGEGNRELCSLTECEVKKLKKWRESGSPGILDSRAPGDVQESCVISKIYGKNVLRGAAEAGAVNRVEALNRDAPRPDFSPKHRERNLALLHSLLANNTAHPFGGSKPHASTGVTTLAGMHGTRHLRHT